MKKVNEFFVLPGVDFKDRNTDIFVHNYGKYICKVEVYEEDETEELLDEKN